MDTNNHEFESQGSYLRRRALGSTRVDTENGQ